MSKFFKRYYDDAYHYIGNRNKRILEIYSNIDLLEKLRIVEGEDE